MLSLLRALISVIRGDVVQSRKRTITTTPAGCLEASWLSPSASFRMALTSAICFARWSASARSSGRMSSVRRGSVRKRSRAVRSGDLTRLSRSLAALLVGQRHREGLREVGAGIACDIADLDDDEIDIGTLLGVMLDLECAGIFE